MCPRSPIPAPTRVHQQPTPPPRPPAHHPSPSHTHPPCSRHLVLEEVDEDGRCGGGGVGVLGRQAAADVGGGGHGDALHAGLEEVDVGERGDERPRAQQRRRVLVGQLLQRLRV